MSQPQTCITCGMAREVCPDCGGQICSDNCPDQTCECMVTEDRTDA